MEKRNIPRTLLLPDRSFFLFGPRGIGKSTWLRTVLPDAFFVDLLNTSLYLELSQHPDRLEAMIGHVPEGGWVVIDEIQKIAALLDEVHRLMETRRWLFALCGSSARKLRRGGTNLLAGRAVTRDMEAFCSAELQEGFDLDFSCQWGMLPLVQQDRQNAVDILSSYFNTYIKEEIKEENIIRSLPPFLRFLGIAGLLNGQQVNGQSIAREASVPRSNVDVYFSILVDTLLGHFLPAYRPKAKVREQSHPKFYWFDTGVARVAAGLLHDPIDRHLLGSALETLIFHELRVYNQVSGQDRPLYYYRTGTGVEIDFIIETKKGLPHSAAHVVCLEVKLAGKWDRKWEKPMQGLKASGTVEVDGMYGIYTGPERYLYDGVQVLPVNTFLELLYQGKIY